MKKKEQLKQIAAYLLRLDANTLHLVLKVMNGSQVSTLDGCTSPKPKEGETVNGEWHCINGQWVWIPEIG